MRLGYLLVISIFVLLTTACVSPPPSQDYTEFRNSDPHTILVLPPLNKSTEVLAPYAVMSRIIAPISESGFYVLPVALVNQTFNNNGLTEANDIHGVPITKLHEIFGADAALYMDIQQYGTSYNIISSATTVTVSATLVDLKTGAALWRHAATASSAENNNSGGGGIIGMLVAAAVSQIVETVSDTGFNIAAMTTSRLLSSEAYNGLLHGPRSPKYGQPATSEKK